MPRPPLPPAAALLADRQVRPLSFRLLAIGDRRQATPAAVAALVGIGGADVALLLRESGIAVADLTRWADSLLPVCRSAGALLLVHGSAEVAFQTGADGVHLPEGGSVEDARSLLGATAWVGASRHDEAGVRAGAAAGADYLTLSPVFASPLKGEPLGLTRFSEIARASDTPVVALGGVTASNAAACRGAGAAAVAAIRAVWAEVLGVRDLL